MKKLLKTKKLEQKEKGFLHTPDFWDCQPGPETKFRPRSYCIVSRGVLFLEESPNLTSCGVNIDTAVGRIGGRTRHQLNRT